MSNTKSFTSPDTIRHYLVMIQRIIDAALVEVSKNRYNSDDLLSSSYRILHTAKEYSEKSIEVIFVPKAMFRQLILAIVLQSGAVVTTTVWRFVYDILSQYFSSRARMTRQLLDRQKEAESMDEWMALANEIDVIQGNDLWRSDPHCALYENDRIEARIDEFVHLMRRSDVFDLMFTLRGGLTRAKFGLLHEGLFSKAMAGTKLLVENYQAITCAALDFACDKEANAWEEKIPTDARLAFFNETRHSYGRTAFLLSGGAALGMYHMGVAKCLLENGLMPRVISGASAGSICAAMIATRTNKECFEDLFNVRGTNAPGHSGEVIIHFFRPSKTTAMKQKEEKEKAKGLKNVLHSTVGAVEDPKLLWQGAAPQGLRVLTSNIYDFLAGHRRAKDLLMNDTNHFHMCLRKNIGNFTFQEAFDRTGRILNITVSPTNKSDPPRLLNYLSAPHVLVWSAAAASSSLPGVFKASRLLVKDPDGKERLEEASSMRFQDGSMEADLPMEQLSEMFNINHFIISQTNPHAYMFSSFSLSDSVWTNPILGLANGLLFFVKSQVKSWIRNMIHLIGGRRIAPVWDTRRGFFSQFFLQEYEGRDIDITINPWRSHQSLFGAFLHLIYNPSPEEFMDWIKAAERETWKYLPAIRSHCAVEMTLDRCVQRLRRRVVDESWENHYVEKQEAHNPETMIDRLPSFYQSPSLVNMGGLAIADQVIRCHSPRVANKTASSSSLAGLNQSGSSGIFVDEESETESTLQRNISTSSVISQERYLKTTNMTNFYYRNTKSQDNLNEHNFVSPIPDDSIHYGQPKTFWNGNPGSSVKENDKT